MRTFTAVIKKHQKLRAMKKFSIYQIREDAPDSRYIKFSSLEMLEHLELRDKLSLELYEKVYEGEIEEPFDLEDIYCKFQGPKPEGYKGHSLSISDLIEIDEKFYYVDDFGFKEIQFS